MAPSRIADDYRLSLSFDPPEIGETDYLRLLAQYRQALPPAAALPARRCGALWFDGYADRAKMDRLRQCPMRLQSEMMQQLNCTRIWLPKSSRNSAICGSLNCVRKWCHRLVREQELRRMIVFAGRAHHRCDQGSDRLGHRQ